MRMTDLSCIRKVLCLLAVLAVSSATGSSHAAGPPQVAHRWALLIGVDDYANANKLRFCGADQQALKSRLQAAGFSEDQIFVMHDKANESRYRPSQRNIEKQLDVVLRLAAKDDLLVVAFSGHGVSISGRSYLCPNDATLDDPATLVSLDDLYERLQRCEATFKLVLVDACRNDPRLGGQRSLSATKETQALARSMLQLRLPDGMVLLNSCAPGEISYEEPDFGHGVFMHYVLEGLSGAADANRDGAVSLNELQNYAGNRTKTYVARKFNDSQRPFFRGDLTTDALEYALLPIQPGMASGSLTVQSVMAESLAAARAVADPKERSSQLRFIALFQSALPDLVAAKTTMAEAVAAARAITDPEKRSDQLHYIAPDQAKLPDLVAAKTTIAEAAAAARAISDPKKRSSQLSWVAKSSHEAGDSAGAKQILSEALINARRTESTIYISVVAEAQAESEDLVAAARTFEEAKSIARRSSIASFQLCDIATEQVDAGMEAAGRATYDEARRYGKIGDSRVAQFFGALAKSQVRKGNLKAAHEAASAIRDKSSYYAQSAFCKIAQAQAERGDLKGAQATANWLTADGPRSLAWWSVVDAMVERGDIGGAMSALAGISKQDIRDRCFRKIGEAQLETGDHQGALLTLRSMSDSDERVQLLAEIAAAFAQQRDPSAESLFDEARTATTLRSDKSLHWSVAEALAKAGRWDQAAEFARSAATPEAKAYALKAIAKLLHERDKNSQMEVASE